MNCSDIKIGNKTKCGEHLNNDIFTIKNSCLYKNNKLYAEIIEAIGTSGKSMIDKTYYEITAKTISKNKYLNGQIIYMTIFE